MKKGYQEILSLFEKNSSSEITISYVLKYLPHVTPQDLFELEQMGLLEVNYNKKDTHGDHPHKLTKAGFNHLWELRVYGVGKQTNKLTNWIIVLTVSLIILGAIQTLFTILQYFK
jgi:hypothetical protein